MKNTIKMLDKCHFHKSYFPLYNNVTIITVRNIHETLNEIIEEHKDEPEPVSLDKTDGKKKGGQGDDIRKTVG